MEKIYRFSLLSNARENILLAAVFYLLSNRHSDIDVIMLCVAILFLMDAMLFIIKDTTKFKWDRAIQGFFVGWTILKAGMIGLSYCLDNSEWFKQVLPILDNITLVLAFVAMLTMFVMAFTYLILQKRGKWNFVISSDKVTMRCMGDYLTIMILLIAFAHPL
ncbi:MAG: hypothetical protein ACI3Z5_01225 [Paludibacteraceae bacterium]